MYRRDLGGGLALRWSTAVDLERLGALYGDVFRDGPDAPPNTSLQTQVGDQDGERAKGGVEHQAVIAVGVLGERCVDEVNCVHSKWISSRSHRLLIEAPPPALDGAPELGRGLFAAPLLG